jgi:two-component system sensor histidine kinase BaeS
MAISGLRSRDTKGRVQPYTLFLGGKEIGRVELKFLKSKKELVFEKRSNKLLFLSLVAVGGAAIFLSIVFSKKLTNPIRGLTDAVSAIGEGNLKQRVTIIGRDEIGRLAGAFNQMAHTLEIQESLRKKLTSNIAHELRTPLSAVRGELEAMMDGFIPADKEHIQSLYAEIGRLRTLIEGIEDLSQAEASGLSLNRQRFELAPFLKNIVVRLSKVFQDKGVRLEAQYMDGLMINADPDRLSQIIINLLGNALKASGKNGNVWIRTAANGPGISIEVIDDGCGIKKEDLPFIFERFYKASEGGLGLGLTIVKELAEAHGGKIEADSEYGKGARFTVTLPA